MPNNQLSKINELANKDDPIYCLLTWFYDASQEGGAIAATPTNDYVDYTKPLIDKLNQLILDEKNRTILNPDDSKLKKIAVSVYHFILQSSSRVTDFSVELFKYCLKYLSDDMLNNPLSFGFLYTNNRDLPHYINSDSQSDRYNYSTNLSISLSRMFYHKYPNFQTYLAILSQRVPLANFVLDDNSLVCSVLKAGSDVWKKTACLNDSNIMGYLNVLIDAGLAIPSSQLKQSEKLFSFYYITEYLTAHLKNWEDVQLQRRVENLRILIQQAATLPSANLINVPQYFVQTEFYSDVKSHKLSAFNHRNWIKLFINNGELRVNQLWDALRQVDFAPYAKALKLANQYCNQEGLEKDEDYINSPKVFQQLAMTWKTSILLDNPDPESALAISRDELNPVKSGLAINSMPSELEKIVEKIKSRETVIELFDCFKELSDSSAGDAYKESVMESLIARLNVVIEQDKEAISNVESQNQNFDLVIRDFTRIAGHQMRNFEVTLFEFCIHFLQKNHLHKQLHWVVFVNFNQKPVAYHTTLYMYLAFLFYEYRIETLTSQGVELLEASRISGRIQQHLHCLSKMLTLSDFVLSESHMVKFNHPSDKSLFPLITEMVESCIDRDSWRLYFIPPSAVEASSKLFSFFYISQYLDQHLAEWSQHWNEPKVQKRLESLLFVVELQAKALKNNQGFLDIPTEFLKSSLFNENCTNVATSFNYRNWIELFTAGNDSNKRNANRFRGHILEADFAPYATALKLAKEYRAQDGLEKCDEYKNCSETFKKLINVWREMIIPDDLSPQRALEILVTKLVSTEKIADISLEKFKQLVDACRPVDLACKANDQGDCRLQLNFTVGTFIKSIYQFSVYLYCLKKGATEQQLDCLLVRMGEVAKPWVTSNTARICMTGGEYKSLAEAEKFLFETPVAKKYLIPIDSDRPFSRQPFSFTRVRLKGTDKAKFIQHMDRFTDKAQGLRIYSELLKSEEGNVDLYNRDYPTSLDPKVQALDEGCMTLQKVVSQAGALQEIGIFGIGKSEVEIFEDPTDHADPDSHQQAFAALGAGATNE